MTIHLSPKGEDKPDCGITTKKCQTIDYAINRTDKDLTLVFKTSSTESLKYNLTKSLTKRNWSISLHFVKDDPQGLNPQIYGNNQSFIGDHNKEVEITFNSIGLRDVNLVDVNDNPANVTINIIGASIYLSRSNFISLKHAIHGFRIRFLLSFSLDPL